MTYRQVRGRAASLSPKSRPKIPLSAQSALGLPRNPLPAACTVRKTHRFVNGGRVPYNGQAGAAIGCSGSASDFSHRLPTLRTHGRMGTSFSRSFAHTFPGHFPSNKPPTRLVYFDFDNFCGAVLLKVYLRVNFVLAGECSKFITFAIFGKVR